MTVQMEIDDDLLNALKVIKKECKKHQDCEGCPLVSVTGDSCIVEDAPGGWNLEPRIVLD